MKKLQLLLVSIAMLSMFSCSDDDDDTLGVWYRRSDFDGRAREDAAGFVIDNRGYLCGGYRGKDQRERDCWEYNIDNDWWTQCADLPEEAAARNGAVGFAINSKGYVTTGYTVYRDDDPLHTGGYAYLKDTWEYEPATDTWKQMDDYPGDARINAIAFAIGNYGYVGTGQSKDDKQTKDFYRFDPTAASGNQWTIVNGFGGQKRTGGLSFIIDNVAYIVGGTNNGKDVDDFWKFDPSKSEENKWVRLRDITDQSSDDYDDDYKSITRTYGCAFVIDDQAYITLGQTAPVVSEVITGYTILLKTYGAAVKRKMILTTLLSKEVHASKRFVSLPADEVLSLPEAAAAIIMTIHGSYIHMNGKRMTKRKILGCSVAGILIVIACLSFPKHLFLKQILLPLLFQWK